LSIFTNPVLKPTAKINDAYKISTFPNPTTGLFNLKTCSYWVNAELIIHDVAGKIVLKRKIDKAEDAINFAGQAKGVYILRISKNGIVENRKIILQ